MRDDNTLPSGLKWQNSCEIIAIASGIAHEQWKLWLWYYGSHFTMESSVINWHLLWNHFIMLFFRNFRSTSLKFKVHFAFLVSTSVQRDCSLFINLLTTHIWKIRTRLKSNKEYMEQKSHDSIKTRFTSGRCPTRTSCGSALTKVTCWIPPQGWC